MSCGLRSKSSLKGPNEVEFRIDGVTARVLYGYLGKHFKVNRRQLVTKGSDGAVDTYSSSSDPPRSDLREAPSDISSVLWNADNLNERIGLIADSLTETMRVVSLNVTSRSGQALQYRSWIQISWLWIILPSVLALASLVLLILVIIQTRVTGADVWKTASLPLLFHGLEGWAQKEYHFEDRQGLERKGKRMRGGLDEDWSQRVFVRYRH